MIEIPESANLAREISETMKGKKIVSAVADYSPHKFAWYHGEPSGYNDLLEGRIIEGANGFGGMVEILAQGVIILFTDGVSIRYHGKGEKRPEKHQLLIEFEDETALSASVQMYGGLWCFIEGDFDNIYYKVSKEKPSPLSDEFDIQYYNELFSKTDLGKMSLKSYLATEQRIPGLGNGVLQDILLSAGLHPKKKAVTLTEDERETLYNSIKSTLKDMTQKGGRNTEKSLYGGYGGYETKLSKNTLDKPCPICGSKIIKESYMGGSIYFCEGCQKL